MFASQKNMMSSKSMGRCWPDLLRRRVRLFKCHGYTNSVISEGGKNLSAWVVFKRFLLMEQSGDVLSGVIHIWHRALALSSLTCRTTEHSRQIIGGFISFQSFFHQNATNQTTPRYKSSQFIITQNPLAGFKVINNSKSTELWLRYDLLLSLPPCCQQGLIVFFRSRWSHNSCQ